MRGIPTEFRSSATTYLLTWAVGVILLCIPLIQMGYEQSFLTLNALRLPWLDFLMPHYTHVGDGLILASLGATILLIKGDFHLLILLVITLLLVMVLVSVFKNLVFTHWGRPAVVFAAPPQEFFMTSTRPLSSLSFPSGHTTAAAAAGFLPALATRSRWGGLVLGLLMLAVGYSRIYIGVHFVGDVVAGACLGLGIAWGALISLNAPVQAWWLRQHDYSREIFRRIAWLISLLVGVIGVVSLYFVYYG
ncbi:MAG: phosphatase PAP2 family protein [Bacteroidota bacterium]